MHNWSWLATYWIESIRLNIPASGLVPGPVAPLSLPEAEGGQSSTSKLKELPPKPRLEIFKTTSGTGSSQKPPRFVSIKVERMTLLRINKKWCVSRFKWLMPLKNIEYFYQHLVNWYVLYWGLFFLYIRARLKLRHPRHILNGLLRKSNGKGPTKDRNKVKVWKMGLAKQSEGNIL